MRYNHRMHPNAKWLIAQDERFEAGDVEGYFGGYAEDVTVHVAGTSAIGGTAHGREAMMAVFQRFQESAETMEFERHAVLADDDHGVLLWRVRLTRGDATFDGTEAMVVHFRDGSITEAWIDFEDRYAFDDFVGPAR